MSDAEFERMPTAADVGEDCVQPKQAPWFVTGFIPVTKEILADAEFARNVITLRMEDMGAPLSDKRRAELDAWKREQRRLVVRFRNLRRKVRGRLSDTWDVLRHGLPDPYDY